MAARDGDYELVFGVLECRWSPLERISTQPCCCNNRMTSRTFNGISSIL